MTPKRWFALALLLVLNVLNWGRREVIVVDAIVAGLMALLLLATRLWPDKVSIGGASGERAKLRRGEHRKS